MHFSACGVNFSACRVDSPHAEQYSCGNEKVHFLASVLSSVGWVTKAARIPKKAKGVFIPPIGSSGPGRSHHLLAS